MSSEVHSMSHTQVREVQGQKYIVLRIDQMSPTPRTVEELARAVRLSPERVHNNLLKIKANAHAVTSICEENQASSLILNLTDYGEHCIEGFELVSGPVVDAHERSAALEPFAHWLLGDIRDEVVLELSPEYHEVLMQSQPQRSRRHRLEELAPQFEEFTKLLAELDGEGANFNGYARGLDTWNREYRKRVAHNSADLPFLSALNELVNLLLHMPAEHEIVDETDRRHMMELGWAVERLQKEAYQALVVKPGDQDPWLESMFRLSTGWAEYVLKTIEHDDFKKGFKLLLENESDAPHGLVDRAIETLTMSFAALLTSPLAEDVLEKHVLPTIELWSSYVFDLEGLIDQRRSDIDEQERKMRDDALAPGRAPAASDGVFWSIAAHSRTPWRGTRALMLSWAIAAPLYLAQMMSASQDNAVACSRFSGTLYRAIMNVAGLGCQAGKRGGLAGHGMPGREARRARVELWEAVWTGDGARMRQVKWGARLNRTPLIGAALGLLNIASLAAHVREDGAATLTSWARIAEHLVHGGRDLGIVLCHKARWARSAATGSLGRSLGLVGGVIGLLVGAYEAGRAYGEGEIGEAWVAGIGALGGGVSAMGFVVALAAPKLFVFKGLALSSTGVGVQLGSLLIVVGLVIGVGVGIVRAVRSRGEVGSKRAFESLISSFERPEGVYGSWIGSSSMFKRTEVPNELLGLRDALELVKSTFKSIRFWDVHGDAITYLRALGFNEYWWQVITNTREPIRFPILPEDEERRKA